MSRMHIQDAQDAEAPMNVRKAHWRFWQKIQMRETHDPDAGKLTDVQTAHRRFRGATQMRETHNRGANRLLVV